MLGARKLVGGIHMPEVIDNDLPSQIPGGLLLQYADDTTLICSAPSVQDAAILMNSHLKIIIHWTVNNYFF